MASGYALLDLLVVSVLTLLVVASYKSEFGTLGKYIIIGFVSLIYSYLWRLVRDVDDPFEYSPDGERTGAAEVELFPLTEYQARARDRLAGKTLEERYASAQRSRRGKAGCGAKSGPVDWGWRRLSVHWGVCGVACQPVDRSAG